MQASRRITLANASSRAARVGLIIDDAEDGVWRAFGVDQRGFRTFGQIAIAVDDVNVNRRRVERILRRKHRHPVIVVVIVVVVVIVDAGGRRGANAMM